MDVKVVQLKTIFIEEKIHSINPKDIREVEVDQRKEKDNCVVKNVVKNTQKQESHVFAIYQNIKEKEKYQLMVVKFVDVMAVMIENILMIHTQADLEASLSYQV